MATKLGKMEFRSSMDMVINTFHEGDIFVIDKIKRSTSGLNVTVDMQLKRLRSNAGLYRPE